MTTKEELEQTILDLKEKLEDAQEKLANLNKYGITKPENDEIYWYVNNDDLTIECTHFCEQDYYDISHYNTYNCFKTEEEARKEANRILIKRKLKSIANKLNNGKKIDWNNYDQEKYYITYTATSNRLYMTNNTSHKREGATYCLSEDFLDVAIKEIGEEELINYVKGE